MSEQENTETSNKSQVTSEELDSLRQQLKQKADESKALEDALHTERRARQETGAKLSEEVSNRFSAQESAIENAILAATAEIDGLEKQQTQLMEEGKFGEASKISRLIASAQYKLDGAQFSKSQLGTYKQNAERQAEVAKSDPLAQYSESAKSWIRKNPAFLSDKKTNARVMAAHNLAVADDVEVDSPDYFARLDEVIRPKVTVETKEDDNAEEPIVTTKPQQPKASSGAPVSRGGHQSGGSGGKRIQLTSEQAEAAVISFPNLAPKDAYVKYADNIQKLKEAGRL